MESNITDIMLMSNVTDPVSFHSLLTVLGKFSAEEQRKTATQGRAAIISPPPLASFPRPLVTWYKDGHKIIPNNRM